MTTLASLFRLYVIPAAHRRLAHEQVKEQALAMGLTDLVAHVERALAHDRELVRRESRWSSRKARKKLKQPPERKELDREMDRLFRCMRDLCAVHADLPLDVPTVAAARALQKEIFVSGMTWLTQAAWAEQNVDLEWVLDQLTGGKLQPHVQTLGLGPLVARLLELNTRFGQLLITHPPEEPDMNFASLQAGRDVGQELLLETVARVVGRFPSGSPQDAEAREQLLRGILRANSRMADIRKKRHGKRKRVDGSNTLDKTPEPSGEPG